MTPQAQRVVAVLGARDRHPTARAWLAAVLDAVGDDPQLEADTLAQIVAQCRADLAHDDRHIADDGESVLWFWRSLRARHPGVPRIQAVLAEQLLQHGDESERREGFARYLEATRADPEQFLAAAGEFHDYARDLGGDVWIDYRLARIRFYRAEVERGELEEDTLREDVVELLGEVRADDEAHTRVTAELRRLALS